MKIKRVIFNFKKVIKGGNEEDLGEDIEKYLANKKRRSTFELIGLKKIKNDC